MKLSLLVSAGCLIGSLLLGAIPVYPADETNHPDQAAFGDLTRIANIDHEPINELSGLVKSKRYPDVYWAHNDSGDSARLFALNRQGKILFPDYLASRFYGEKNQRGKQMWAGLPVHLASNIDWEDIAVDADFIYISDMGNNGNARRDQGIYMLFEPNPRATPETRSLKFLPVRFADQTEFPASVWHYDSEGLFVFEGKLYVLSKHRKPGEINGLAPGVDLYRLDTSFTDQPNLLVKVDSSAKVLAATAADLSPDGQNLAILSYTALWVFQKPVSGDHWLSQGAQVLELNPEVTGQAEAVCWDSNDTLLIANEQRQLFQVSFTHPIR
jgi:hypothetical protein